MEDKKRSARKEVLAAMPRPEENPDGSIRYGNHSYVKEAASGSKDALRRDDGAVFPYGLEFTEA